MKEFNTTGVCIPEKHYMVDISSQLDQIENDLVDKGKYFTINRARQYGKTTTLYLLGQRLKNRYIVCSISFEAADDYFTSYKTFVKGVMLDISDELKRADVSSEIINGWNEEVDADLPMRSFSQRITWLCEQLDNRVVLIIDEVDKNSDNQIFLTFLGMLRDKYLDQKKGIDSTFQSVILSGVYDIKNMKLKVRPEEERKYNSPWNVADDFEVDMSFSARQIEDMLKGYSKESGFRMNTTEMSELIADYTSGYPYLVSRLCQAMDEESKRTGDSCWNREHFNLAVKNILKNRCTLFDDINKNMNRYPELSEIIRGILLKGRKYSYSLADDTIQLGVMFGYFAEISGEVVIANRIFETYMYDMFYKAVETGSPIVARSELEKNEFINNGVLNISHIIERFAVHYHEMYSESDKEFLEEECRFLFLTFIKPIINGTGNYYIEARTRDRKRMDIVIDYLGHQYIIELKVWRGDAYDKKGEQQLSGYMKSKNADEGWQLTFCFLKNRESYYSDDIVKIDDGLIYKYII